MAIELLGEAPKGLLRKQPVFAVHGPNVASELGAADLVSGTIPTANPVVLALLNPGPAAPFSRPEEAAVSPPAESIPSLVRLTAKSSISRSVLSLFHCVPREMHNRTSRTHRLPPC